jgi:transcriptional antiterminator RfaH
MDHWYALHTKPRQEEQVREQLENRGLEAYLPSLVVAAARQRATTQRAKPFFPRYLFARLDLETIPLSSIVYMPGMSTVVSFGGEPATVPDAVVDYLRQRLARIDSPGFLEGAPLRQGDPLRVTSGPLRDLSAIFDRPLSPDGRVRVLVKLMGRLSACEIPIANLSRI